MENWIKDLQALFRLTPAQEKTLAQLSKILRRRNPERWNIAYCLAKDESKAISLPAFNIRMYPHNSTLESRFLLIIGRDGKAHLISKNAQ